MSGPDFNSVLWDHPKECTSGDCPACECGWMEGDDFNAYNAHVAEELNQAVVRWLRSVDPVEVALSGIDYLLAQFDPQEEA